MSMPPLPFWEDLLEHIDDRQVIPIVGAELLRVPQDGRDVPLQVLIAQRLAARLGVPADDLPAGPGDDALHAVICRHLERGGRREDVYTRLRTALKDAPLPVPPALRKLARVQHFDLFVSTTFDSLLEQAINEERFGGAPKAQSIAYAPKDVQDLPGPMKDLTTPTVFHLLGRLSAMPRAYALTEEDLLEFLYALQSDERRPKRLFQELRANHLLLIGNHFPDWLARFFIRLAKGGPLSDPRDATEILADRMSHEDQNLVLFLKNFSYHTQVYAEGGATEFVDELAERYLARHPPDRPAAAAAAAAVPQAAPAGAQDVLPPGSVFLSYASEDRASVQRIHDALESAGIDVWFDRHQLEGGDDYAMKIRRNVKGCSLFVPVISANTQARLEGFFRREWKWAADRAEDFAAGVPFIVPVCLDETPEADAFVPDKFLDVQWTRLIGGEVTPEFAQRMVRLIRDFRKRQRGTT